MAVLAEFLKAQVQDYHRSNLFSCLFDPPFIASNKLNYSSIMVRTAQIPGQTINTVNTIYNNKKQNFASTIDLDPVTFEIYCSNDNKAHSFFLEWQSKTISQTTRLVNYKTAYAGSVDIDIHDKLLLITGKVAASATLINAFPINVSPVELSQDDENGICKFTVTFIYDDVEYTFANGLVSRLLSFGVGLANLI